MILTDIKRFCFFKTNDDLAGGKKTKKELISTATLEEGEFDV